MSRMPQRSSFRLSVFLAAGAVGLWAQTGAPFSSQENALGGKFGAAGMGRPLGGVGRPERGTAGRGGHRDAPLVGAYGGGFYGSSYYVPGYFDIFGGGTPSSVASYTADSYPVEVAPPPLAPAVAPAAPAAPTQVIINQYFNGVPAPLAQAPAQVAERSPGTAGEPLGPVENYYLIAYKDHSVHAAISYWLEDKTLHYVTDHNEHNQVSLDLIDLTVTKNLNQTRDIPFELPGR